MQPRVPDSVANYVSTLKEFYLIGALLPTLPNNSVLETVSVGLFDNYYDPSPNKFFGHH